MNSLLKKLLSLWVISSFIVVTAGNLSAREQYVFGVHPFKKPTTLLKMFSPLIDYLEKELDADISFRSAKNYDSAMTALVNGEIDISYLGPAPFAMLAHKYPGRLRPAGAIVNKNGMTTFKGVIVAKEGSDINQIADLRGKKIALGDRKSTLSCYMPVYMLMQEKIFHTVEYRFLGSHDNVAKGVLKGLFAAGGLKPNVARKYVGRGLKIIAESEPVYEHLVVIGPRVDSKIADKIQAALLKIDDPKVYRAIKSDITGFAPVKIADYDNLQQIIKVVNEQLP